MRIDSVRFDASGNATFVASGGISFFIPHARIQEIPNKLPEAGDELDEENDTLLAITRIAGEEEALSKALSLCSRAEQSSQGLRAKLANRKFSRSAVEYAIRELEYRGIVDDARYASIWARIRAEHRLEGPLAIGSELRARGFGERTVKSALDLIDFDSILEKAFEKELRGEIASTLSREELNLIAKSLKLRGFRSESIGLLIEKST